MTAFLAKYTNGFPPHYMYLRHEMIVYPLKALWAASHRPVVSARTFNSVQARNGFRKLGFHDAIKIDGSEQRLIILDEVHNLKAGLPFLSRDDVMLEAAIEGARSRKEISTIKRNAAIVAKAKRELGFDCQVCGFNFENSYGEHGRGFIEAHHVEPLSGRDVGRTTSIKDFAMLCANCHRMVHRAKEPIPIDELVKIVRKNKAKSVWGP